MKRKKFTSEDSGSFTLEATLVFPILLLVIVIVILFVCYIYEKAVLYGAASVTSEQTAFLWDNSYRNANTGLAGEGDYDGLYWRIKDDELVQSLFGLSEGDEADAMIPIGDSASSAPTSSTSDAGSLTELKLKRTTQHLEGVMIGENRYKRKLTSRFVETALRTPMESNVLSSRIDHYEQASMASSIIVDPAEFIRTVDLVRYYTSKLGSSENTGTDTNKKQEAGKVLSKTLEKSPQPKR
ncbi:TadE-like protein [Paenibacillus cellulosilyticus]|uniref:TadE-like protein n=1 Tax=Paenibacillus cellulosilyticus TaxID=375489 RepID=A0A2V2YT36_9BACL|nr:pilus assembly protein TadE [Paenibacillus cellulosilyticus]PWW02492.1 TadE-like protein [Paenibacillus cellulosilyticus]QKS47198.1 pilus assembly protein [Paenibacillus cellulosilyticus]